MSRLLAPGVVLVWFLVVTQAALGKPELKANQSIAVVSDQFSRWSEGGFLALNDKDVLLVVTGYHWKPSNSDNNHASLYAFWSHDGGITWTPQEEAEEIQTPEEVGMQNVMSVSLLKLKSGDVLMSFFAYKKARDYGGTFLRRSQDNGRTWSQPRLLGSDLGGMPGRNFQTPDGRIVMPVYVGKMGSATLVSDDDGATWQRSNIVDDYEPTVVLLKDGRLLMYLRTDKGEIYQSYSEDNGLTWSKSQPSGIPSPSSMSTLKRLQNGDLMLIFNKVRDRGEINGPWPRIRLCTMISQDEGQSWGKLRYLDGGDQFVDILKITMASVVTVGDEDLMVAWSRSPLHCRPHNNLYDYRFRKFNLQWLYAGNNETTYPDSNQ